jgi:hypothetical protein
VAATPSSSGIHRSIRNELTRNTSRPHGRKSRAASGTQRCGSAHRHAPYSETAKSKLASGYGTASAFSMSHLRFDTLLNRFSVPLLWLSAKAVFRPVQRKAARRVDDASLEGPFFTKVEEGALGN